jgi:uncharacterized phage protein (TIGR02218 family)
MRDIPEPLASRLGGATTLCHCWRLIPRDGTHLGFTDHDRDLIFDGTTFLAGSGLDPGAMESDLGFVVGGGEVSGALTATALSEADIIGGRYDGATVETWLVDWAMVNARVLLDTGVIGEVRRSEFAFTAEVRSIAHELDQPVGRYYQSGCAADLGDVRCGVDTTDPAFRATGGIVATDGRLTFTIASSDFADGWFTNGVAQFVGGANAGLKVSIKSHVAATSGSTIALWTPVGGAIAIGDAVTLIAGCDKRLATCANKFANQINFRGFPHIPGIDTLLSYANANTPAMDGGSLFR